MDKTSERVNRLTLDFSNKVYEELSTIVSQREDLRYFNHDSNDKNIDNKINKMFDLLDDVYNSCIEKKIGWITKDFTLVPENLQSCKGVSLKVNEEIDKRIYTTPS